MGTMVLDLRQSIRWLVRNPGFTLVAMAVLGLGIGVATVGFGFVDAVLLSPPAVEGPENLVAIYAHPEGSLGEQPLRRSEVLDLERQSTRLAEVVTYAYAPMAVEEDGSARLVLGCRISPDFFDVLGVEPALGRFLDEHSRDRNEVVLGYSAWQRRWGSDPGVVGSTVRVDGRPMRVVGVGPAKFEGPTRGVAPEVWSPLDESLAAASHDTGRSLWTLGRRAEGASFEQTVAEVETLSQRWRANPASASIPEGTNPALLTVIDFATVRILPGIDTRLATASAVLLWVVLLVMLVAVFNVANLILARAVARRPELATRRALGASTWALVRQGTVENLLLALLGAGLGLGFAVLAQRGLRHLETPLPVDLTLDLGLDVRVVVFALALAIFAALTLGVGQGWNLGRGDGASARGTGLGPGTARRRWQSILVVGQVGLSALLLVLAGLMVRSAANAHRVDLGFEPDGVVVVTLAPGLRDLGDGGTTRERARQYFDQLRTEVGAMPEVASVGLASHLPLTIELRLERITSDGEHRTEPEDWPVVDAVLADPGYFQTLGIPHLAGRVFDDRDRPESSPVVVVNQSLASQFWPGRSAIGRRLRLAGSEVASEVVGVVADSKVRTLGEASRPVLYRALDQVRGTSRGGEDLDIDTGSETLLVRVVGDPHRSLVGLREVVRGLDPGVPMARLETLDQTLGLALFLPRAAALFFVLLGALAWALSMAGLYGVMAFTVAGRSREIGLRRALGGRRGRVSWELARRGLGLAFLGMLGGMILAWIGGRGLEAWLYGIAPHDPWVFVTVTVLLTGVSLLANWIPAHRASGRDPWRSLRQD